MAKYLIQITLVIIMTVSGFTQTTGKIAGKISDEQDGSPVAGANVMLTGTSIGTASDLNGEYFIINIQPGVYKLRVQMIGYESMIVEDVRVSVNRTAYLDIRLKQTVLEGETVVVKADKVSVKKDQTSTVKNISSDDIDILPVDDIGGIIRLQAGVVAGSFRGGRNTEVTYLIDGVKVDEGFGGTSSSISIEPATVKDLEVITGTFNAEYGKAMSGVVNQITKNGSDKFEGSASADYGNYLTPHSDIFPGIDIPSLNRSTDMKFQLSGPLQKDKVYFFLNYRLQNNLNHLNGMNYFNVSDSSDFSADNPSEWYSEHTGDHVTHDYCADENGVAVLDWMTGNEVTDEETCAEYGTCTIQFSACLDANGDVIEITDDQLYCEQELLGIFGFTTSVYKRIRGDICDAIGSFIADNEEEYPGFMQTVFTPNLYSLRQKHQSLTAMNNAIYRSFTGKLNFFPVQGIRTSIMYTLNDNETHWYSHFYKYNPDGRSTNFNKSEFYTWQTNFMINQSMFIDLKLSRVNHQYGSYVYKDPRDNRYIYDYYYNSESGFLLGGQDKGHTTRRTIDDNIKIDFTWQAGAHHNLKLGIDYLKHNIRNREYTIRDSTSNDDEYTPYIFTGDDVVSPYKTEYDAVSWEYAGYIQDKMEFDQMVINLGLRYDYFDPNRLYPTDYRNPRNTINNADTSRYEFADAKYQVSPRLGIGYQIGDAAVLHFSYGHFFQMPPLYAVYSNYDWLIPSDDFATILGNPNLKAEKTITYEIGLWQKLTSNMGLEVSLYYRDIYELLSTKTITTYNTVKYGLYTNKDYGNVRGLEVKYDFRQGPMTSMINYTLQYTRGNADNPTMSYNREGDNVEPVNKLIPMSWDQRQTLNVTLGYNTRDYGVSVTSFYNSGTPYTFVPQSINPLASIYLNPNNDYKPANYSVDMTGYYNIHLADRYSGRITFSVYNVFDRLNEFGVDAGTGRAFTRIITDTERASFRSNFTTIEDSFQDPGMYAAPRYFKIGLEINL